MGSEPHVDPSRRYPSLQTSALLAKKFLRDGGGTAAEPSNE